MLIFSLSACSQVQRPGGETSPKIATGQKIPDLTFLDSQGNRIGLYSLLQRSNRTALIFYRGYWSSYCQQQFGDLRAKLSEFQEQGIQLVGVSVDEPHLIEEFGRAVEKQYWNGSRKEGKESKEGKEGKESPEGPGPECSFPILSDVNREGIQKLGIGEDHPRFGLVARPTAILLDKEGKIQWFYVGKSQDDRPEPNTVLHARKWY